jgi:hypothetical protein
MLLVGNISGLSLYVGEEYEIICTSLMVFRAKRYEI